MNVLRMCVALAALSAAASSASAQTAHRADSTPAATLPATAPTPAPADDYPIFAGEKHLVVRALAGTALRLNDYYGAGLLAPPWMLIEVHGLLLNMGPLRMGPSLGVQFGFDSHAATQVGVQPGWLALLRLAPRLAITARLDVPIVVTNGPTSTTPVQPPPSSAARSPIQAPTGPSVSVTSGFELGVGAAVYLTSGIALTGEINFDLYFGDSLIPFPVLGAGLGVLIDYELLP